MSYLLGALKKAEKERARDKGMNMDSWNQDDWEEPEVARHSNKSLLLVVAGIIILLLCFILVLLAIQLGVNRQNIDQNNSAQISGISVNRVDLQRATEPQRTEVNGSVSPAVLQPAPSAQVTDIQAATSQTTMSDRSNQPVTEDIDLPKFSGHMYFPANKTLSRVFSEGGSYKEGQQLGRFLVESIEELNVVLRVLDSNGVPTDETYSVVLQP